MISVAKNISIAGSEICKIEKDLQGISILNQEKIDNWQAFSKVTLRLENAKKASKLVPIIIRIPLVPGCNDSEENIKNTASFASNLGKNFQRIELLPYHKFGTQTYSHLGREYKLIDTEPPNDDLMNTLKEIVESCGVNVQIGG